MTADHIAYQRATSVSLFGLGLQILFALLMLLYGIFGQDTGALSASYAMLLGCLVWLGLVLVFHQHRLERLEAMEAATYRTSAAAQSRVFEDEDESGENVQARKLAWMHKWFLPSLSILIAAGLIGLGLGLFFGHRGLIRATEFTPPPASGWGLAIGVVIAVLGFVYARYVAGMAKQPVWSLLHAGAAQAVGASLLGGLVFVSHFVAQALDNQFLLRLLPSVVDLYMVALGVEILLNFVLTLYRPRKPGEYLRPAFDSRVLAFLSAPDRLAESISEAVNYQFGFNVSSTWFYRLVSRSIVLLVVLGMLIGWGLTSLVVVQPDEQALLLRGGKYVKTIDGGGLVLKRPWPLDQVVRYPAERVTRLTIGGERRALDDTRRPILWTTEAPSGERYLVVRASVQPNDRSLALMTMEIPIHYRVTNLRQYLELAQDGAGEDRDEIRRDLLTAISEREILRHMSGYSVSQILGPERGDIARSLGDRLQREFDRKNSGVKLVFTGLQGVRPPAAEEVARAFERVFGLERLAEARILRAEAAAIRELARVVGDAELARQIVAELDRLDQTKTDGGDAAEQLAIEQRVRDLILEARGEAAKQISGAQSQRWVRHMGERSRAELLQGQMAGFRASPSTYMMDIYIRSLVDAMAGLRVWIIEPDLSNVVLDQMELDPEITGFSPSDLRRDEENLN